MMNPQTAMTRQSPSKPFSKGNQILPNSIKTISMIPAKNDCQTVSVRGSAPLLTAILANENESPHAIPKQRIRTQGKRNLSDFKIILIELMKN